MFLPRLMATRRVKRSVNAFGGYRHDSRAGAEQFYDMENLCADRFPLLSTRKKRALLTSLTKPNGLSAINEKLLYADGTTLYYDNASVGSVSDTKKQFVQMGAYVLIWPDKLRFDPQARTLSPLGARFTSSGEVSFSMCNYQAEDYAIYTADQMPPENPSGGALWLDTAQTPNVLKRFSSLSGMWVSISAAYIKIAHAGIGTDFREYDGVTISGVQLGALNTSAVVYAAAEDHLLIAGTLDAAFTQSAQVTISREIPDFDLICEKDNRLWGCSSARHEIACSKLGDAGNWSCTMGISTDSYTLSVGGGGDFTACCAYGGNVLFFKDDRLMKLMGTRPENFQLITTLCQGVEKGSEKSVALLGGALLYHARTGACAYSGALPEAIGAELGTKLSCAVGGAIGDKYYLSAKDESGNAQLFVYDTRVSLWHREDASCACDFAYAQGKGYMLTEEGALYRLEAGNAEGAETLEAKLPWFFETGELIDGGYARPQKLVLRLFSQTGGAIRLRLSYDGGSFEDMGAVQVRRKQPAVLPLRLRRCDSLKLRVQGEGELVLHGFSFVNEESED